MPKFDNITLKLSGETFNVGGTYSPATPDRMYLPNGDPGYPGDPAEFEITEVAWHGTDITSLWQSLELDDRFYEEISEQLAESLHDA